MDSTPISQPSERRTKSASRLSKLRHYSGGGAIPQLSLEIVPSSPKISTPSPSPASTISPPPPYTLQLQELLALSPSPLKRSKTAAAAGDDSPLEVRKRCKSRASASGCGVSPRSGRRSRRRLDQDEREIAAGDEVLAKPRKKRQSRKEKLISSSSSQIVPSNTIDSESYNLDEIGAIINDLVMWKDVSKSSLWFGFGTLCFLSSCFTKGVNFSIFSFLSQVGFLFLGISFMSNSVRQRLYREGAETTKRDFKLKEDDILRIGRLILPAANLVISKTREIFSGEPAMTLKVVPFLLVGAEYGHLITLWRLCALGFFVSFTAPKLCSAYSLQLSKKVEYVKNWAMGVWGSCTHKKIVAASAVTAFWNLTSIRTRVFAVFLCLVVFRYRRQHAADEKRDAAANDAKAAAEEKQEKQEEEKAIVAVEIESKK
ncbi:reticulon-like protein B17 isoform X2 [Salvia miltiorrhiza]|uniref:reticulon-like protein B17 isoform X2 n=1 Tax=Salvia miltiorrhiza TaxID=226208 RepID=UPI0025ACCA01|nr:reticulon-like protein B17 isoform X2 [Salvia miltiorrhiza]